MANLPSDADDGRTAWIWFETEACQTAWPIALHHQIDAHVNELWNRVPLYVKTGLLPTLSKFRTSFQRAKFLHHDLTRTPYLHPGVFENCPPGQLYWRDHFARADDRLATAKNLIDALRAAKETFLAVRQYHNDYPGTLSFEGQQALQNLESSLNSAVLNAENEVKQVEKALPACRQLEEKLRMDKREEGYPEGAGWVGAWFLGSGAFGRASLWVRQDSQGRIVDRMVTKDAIIDNAMNSKPGSRMLHEGMWTPSEIRCPQLLAGKSGSETILKVRGWREFPDSKFFRALLAYCPFGELGEIRNKMYRDSDFGDEDGEFLDEPKLPQAFIWYVFECLAVAGVLMEKGDLNPQAISAWDQMYHSDIKLSKVLLSTPNDNKYAGYPSPILADWGFVQACPAGEDRSSLGGTPHCESPENGGKCYTKAGQYNGTAKLNPKSDVWSVGNVIIGLMDGDVEGYDSLNFRKNPQPRAPDLTHLRGHYSNNLINLAAECTNYYPEDRPSFGHLLHHIRQHTGQAYGAIDEVRGLHSKPAFDPAWQRPENRLTLPTESFQMYRHLASIPDHEKPEEGPRAANLPPPPHAGRKLSEQMEYKGRVSADDTSLRRAGSVRRKAAQLGPEGRNQYNMWMGNRAKEKGKRMRRQEKAKLEEERENKEKEKPKGGYRLVYSADEDDGIDENDGSGDGPDLPVGEDSGSGSAARAGAATVSDDTTPALPRPADIPDRFPQPQDLVQDRFRNALRIRRSRSAGPGARRARADNRLRDGGRSASPRRSLRNSSESSNPYLAPARRWRREKRENGFVVWPSEGRS